MVKIKMFEKGMNTTEFGFLSAGGTHEVPAHFAAWMVKSGRAELSAPVKKAPKKKAATSKADSSK